MTLVEDAIKWVLTVCQLSDIFKPYPNPTQKVFHPHFRGHNKFRKLSNPLQATEPENTYLEPSYLYKLTFLYMMDDTTMGTSLNNGVFC